MSPNPLFPQASFPGPTLAKRLRALRNEKQKGPHRWHEDFESHLDAVEAWLKNGAEIGHMPADAFHGPDEEFEHQREEAEMHGNEALVQLLEEMEVIHDHARIRTDGDLPSADQLEELELSLYGPDEDEYDGDQDMADYLDGLVS